MSAPFTEYVTFEDLSDDENGGPPQKVPGGRQFHSMSQEMAAALKAQKVVAVEVPNGAPLHAAEPAKKKKRKSKKKKKSSDPTGFEASYAEAPLTPVQAQELLKIYSPKIPFAERIETCIQRYRAKRRWDILRSRLFSSYLVLGGIRAGQKAFGGGLSIEGRGEDGEDADAADIAAQTATDFVNNVVCSDRNTDNWKGTPGVFEDDEEEWWVDFDYVAKAFLSHRVPFVYCLHTEQDLVTAVSVVRNFLNYIIFHSVCPEYSQNLRTALRTCDQAEKELLFANAVTQKFPGRFNTACSALFGGYYHKLYESDLSSAWEGKAPNAKPIGMAAKDARTTYLGAVGKHGTPQQKDAKVEGTKLVNKELLGLEIVEIQMPEGTQGGKAALGKVTMKVWAPEGERLPRTEMEEITVWFEKEILVYLIKGMRIEATVYALSNGLWYIDSVTAVYTTLYTYLEPPHQSDANDGDDDDGDYGDEDGGDSSSKGSTKAASAA